MLVGMHSDILSMTSIPKKVMVQMDLRTHSTERTS